MSEDRDPLSLSAAEVEQLPVDEAEAALGAWVKARRAELPLALSASPSRAHARLAKKALYQLQSAKVEVARPSPAPAPVAEPPPDDELPAVLSAILGTGERAVFFAVPVRGGGIELYQGIVHDEKGVIHLAAGTARRGQYRQRVKELRADPTAQVLFVSLERMREELSLAVARNARSGTTLGREAQDALLRLRIEPAASERILPALEDGDAGRARGAASLHQEPELTGWLPSEEAIAALGQRLAEVESSPLALTGAQKAEQVELKLAATVDEYLTPARRRVYALRLFDSAELLDATGRAEPAALARGAARHLFHTSERSPFIEQMFRKVVEQRARAVAAGAPPPPVAAPGAVPSPLILP